MPKVMKPPTDYDENDVSTGGDWYDGPPPKPGLYQGKVKKLLLHKVTSGEKKGELRILVICEISQGKYKGAGVTKWLQLTKQGSPWVNQFLHSLTDGSEAQKAAIRKAFKEVGYTVGDPDEKKRLPIIKIGKKTNPVGMDTSFVTKLRTGDDGVERAEIVRFVTRTVTTDDDDEDDDALEGDEAVTGDDGDDDTPEAILDSDDDADDDSEDDDSDEDSPSGDDGDDPWEV